MDRKSHQSGFSIEFKYTAAGVKLSKEAKEGGSTVVKTDYINIYN
jgi:hypothetical protein